MKIGIDGACLANRRGFGRFARQVVRALDEAESPHEFVVFVDRPSRDSVEVPKRFSVVEVDVSEAPTRAASAEGRRSLADLFAMGRAVSRSKLDLMYFPASYSFFPVWRCGRVVVTLHDTLALAHPEWVFPEGKGRLAWKVKEHLAVRRADRIATVSETARRDLEAWFRLPTGRVKVIPEGPAAAFRPTNPGPESDEALRSCGIAPGERFLLYVGGLSPHKNLPRLIEAFARSAVVGERLVLVGDFADVFHTHVPALRAEVERQGLGDRVVFTGFVPDERLAYLYGRAYALVQPSLMEGFGLPPVEAMACGTPVLSSRAGSLPEVVGDAGRFFNPFDVGDIAGAIGGLLANPEAREHLAGLALARSVRYTWSAAAGALLELFGELAPKTRPT